MKTIKRVEGLFKNKGLVFILFLILGIGSQIFVLISPDEVLLNWYSSDDAFYYFKTAQNIAEGRGITFDGFSPTNGFHPLWMVVCIPVFALARFNLYIPLRVLIFILVLMNAGTGYFIFCLFRKKSIWIALLAGMFWMFYLPIHEKTTQMGLETGLTAFMLALYLHKINDINWKRGDKKVYSQLVVVGLAGVGLLLSRLDNIFLLITIGVWIVFHGKKFNSAAQIDFLLLLISVVASFFIRMQIYENMFEYLDFYFLLMALSLVIRPVALYLFGAYKPYKKNILNYSVRIIASGVLSSGLIFIILLMAKDIFKAIYGLPRAVVLFDAGLSLLLILTHHVLQVLQGELQPTENMQVKLFTDLKEWLRRALAYFSPIVLGLSTYLLFNRFYAGTAMPVSGQIKRWWGTLPNTVYGRPISSLNGVLEELLSPNAEKGPFWLLMRPLTRVVDWLLNTFGILKISVARNSTVSLLLSLILLFILIYFLVMRERKELQKIPETHFILPFFVGVFMHAVSYKASGYMHVRGWYWTGELFFILLLFGVVGKHWSKKISTSSGQAWLPKAFAGIASAVIFTQFLGAMIRQYPLDGQVPLQYNTPADKKLFESYTEPGDVIGMTGGGLSAYFIPNRVIVNLDGLINSAEYFEQLRNGDISKFLNFAKVQYLFGSELVFLDSDPYRWFFEDKLVLLNEGEYFNFYKYQP